MMVYGQEDDLVTYGDRHQWLHRATKTAYDTSFSFEKVTGGPRRHVSIGLN